MTLERTADLDAFGILLFLVFAVLAIDSFLVWIWALVDAIKVPNDSDYRAGNKIIWVLVIVVLGVVGGIIYLLVGRPQRASA